MATHASKNAAAAVEWARNRQEKLERRGAQTGNGLASPKPLRCCRVMESRAVRRKYGGANSSLAVSCRAQALRQQRAKANDGLDEPFSGELARSAGLLG